MIFVYVLTLKASFGKYEYTALTFVCTSDNLVRIISHVVEFVVRYMESFLGGKQKHGKLWISYSEKYVTVNANVAI